MIRQLFHIICSIVLLIALSSCSPQKYLTKYDKVLQVKNKIEITQEEQDYQEPVHSYSIERLIRPQESKSFVGSHFPQGIYFKGIEGYEEAKKKDIPGGKRMLMGLGGIAHFHDPIETALTEEKINSYLFNKGYFNSSISSETTIKDRKAKTTYFVNPKQQHVYGNVSFDYDSIANMQDILSDIALQDYMQEGQSFDVEDFVNLRKKMVSDAQEKGYYRFSQGSIFIEPDTLKQQGIADIYVVIESKDSLFNQKFFVNDIYITVYKNGEDASIADTILYNQKTFKYSKNIMIRPNVLDRFLLLETGNHYSTSSHYGTFKKLYELDIIALPNIDFIPIERESDSLFMDAHVTISTKDLMKHRFQPTLSQFLQSTAIGAEYTFTHRNAFKGGEVFDFFVNGGLESGVNNDNQNQFFTTYYYDIQPSLTIPRLLGLEGIFKDTYQNTENQKTRFQLSNGLQNRPGLFRFLEYGAKQTWNWQSSPHNSHNLSLIDVSLIKTNIDPDYLTTLQNTPAVLFSLENRLILASSYTYSYSNAKKRPNKSFYNFEGTFETAGNLAYLLSGKDSLSINGNLVSRYVRGIVDFTYTMPIGRQSSLVHHIYAASANPIGSIKSIPAVKQFFAGGNNSLRGWDARQIGPGSYNYLDDFDPDQQNVDLRGDFRLEANVEYRFPLFKLFGQDLEGVLFTDAGNIWMYNDESREEATISSDFVDEIAIASGLGARLKIQNFLVVRTDFGFKIHDPVLPANNRWVNKPLENANFQFGIGYPF